MADIVLRFSTPGPDRYADGSVVADGECYALVWSPKGTTFSGFNADGTTVASRDRVVLAAPLAVKGKCRDALFQIPAEEYEELKGGEWTVCLVDTRGGNGYPTGVGDGKPLRVNRWGAVKSGVKLEPSTASALTVAAAPQTASGVKLAASPDGGSSGGVRANSLSAVPPSAKQPTITAIEVHDGEVWLAVADTEPYLSYTIVSGAEPGALKMDYFAEVIDGESGEEIAIGTVQSPTHRFFKVKRAE